MNMPINPPQAALTIPRVPRLNELAEFTPSVALLEESAVVAFNGRDQRSRPFNLLRTQVLKRMRERNMRLLGMTSATPGAGKSFISLNLAAALSRVKDAEVYLIDLDLRRGSIADMMGLEVETGIGDFLTGRTDDIASAGVRVAGTGLSIFASRVMREDTADLLSGERYPALLQAFRNLGPNAVVVVDLPPVFANDDAMISVEALDAYMMVIDQGTTTRKQVQETLALLDPAPCLGTVLNRYAGGFNDAYGYGYGAKGYAGYYE